MCEIFLTWTVAFLLVLEHLLSLHNIRTNNQKINVFLRDVCEISFIKSRLLCVFNTICLPCCLLRFKCHVFWLVPIKAKYYFQFVYEISGTFLAVFIQEPLHQKRAESVKCVSQVFCVYKNTNFGHQKKNYNKFCV